MTKPRTIEELAALTEEYLKEVPRTEKLTELDKRILFALRCIAAQWIVQMYKQGAIDLRAEERTILEAIDYMQTHQTLMGYENDKQEWRKHSADGQGRAQ